MFVLLVEWVTGHFVDLAAVFAVGQAHAVVPDDVQSHRTGNLIGVVDVRREADVPGPVHVGHAEDMDAVPDDHERVSGEDIGDVALGDTFEVFDANFNHVLCVLQVSDFFENTS